MKQKTPRLVLPVGVFLLVLGALLLLMLLLLLVLLGLRGVFIWLFLLVILAQLLQVKLKSG